MRQYASFIKWIHSEQGIDAHAWAVAHAFDLGSINLDKTEKLINTLWRSNLAIKGDQLRSQALERMERAGGLERFNKESKKLRKAFDNNSFAVSGLPGAEAIITELDKRIENTSNLDKKLRNNLSRSSYPSTGRLRDLTTIAALDAWKVLKDDYYMRPCARHTVAFIGNIGGLSKHESLRSKRFYLEESLYQAIRNFDVEGR